MGEHLIGLQSPGGNFRGSGHPVEININSVYFWRRHSQVSPCLLSLSREDFFIDFLKLLNFCMWVLFWLTQNYLCCGLIFPLYFGKFTQYCKNAMFCNRCQLGFIFQLIVYCQFKYFHKKKNHLNIIWGLFSFCIE